ncbi:uncharacterized protein F4812DRAFT_437985 [Daldinia caldariorum]|uniref:uncharacterized protein n=1 Tax=Daldinia caldariorum TaxID=326644 RepID=UPI002008261E|nr:uncharacterized protein F4812DRAFT_437985 [Daldinia caldariorum]KAI1465881.1 hypothetical protein F4812DRAFT_437985 [Daldinia caldariorum]
MASRSRHLDATGDREVVYCHSCENEWYRDERPDTLECPRCHQEITEIISPESDPRNLDDDPLLNFEQRRRLHPRFDSDEDPDEEDIDEHLFRGPGGFFGHRTILRSPDGRGLRTSARTAPDHPEQIIRRFTEMISDMEGSSPTGRSGPDTLFGQPSRVTLQRFSGPGFTGGVSSFTITSSSPGRVRPDPSRGPGFGPEDPFQRVFGDIMGDLGPPPMGRDSPNGQNQAAGEGNPRQPADFSLALSQLIASLINPHMAHGDAVYSQEALDRIITNLMEANPQSNAPAPASEEAIAKLPKKKLDEAMLGPELKGECTICIDEVKVGDEAVVLPCKHWFHEQCVVLWLKQHNTCPICRASIDGEAAGRPVASTSNSETGNSQPGPSGTASQPRRQDEGPPLARLRSVQANSYSRPQPFRRDSSSPPTRSGTAPARVRSPSPSSRRSAQSDRARDGRGSVGGPFNWFRDRFGGDRR